MESFGPDERARAAGFDAFLLDVLGDAGSDSHAALTHDESFADLQADLDALDALIEQHTSTPSPLLLPATSPADALPHVATVAAVPATVSAHVRAPLDTSANVAAPPATKPKSAPGGNNARKRQREELRSLRASAAMLEDALHALQHRQGTTSSPRSAAQRQSSSLSPDPTVLRRSGPQSVSKPCATLDEHAQQVTALENVHLSKLVADHVRVTQRFDRALRKHRPLAAADILAEAPRVFALAAAPRLQALPLPSTEPSASDLDAFDALERNVDARYPDVERVFEAVGLAHCNTNVREALLETQRADGVLLSFKHSRLVPFSVELINETAIALGKTFTATAPSHVVRRTGSTVAFRKHFQVGDVTIRARGVSKRYVEATRIVLVWDGVSEWQRDGDSDVLTIDEKGWAIIRPFPVHTENQKGENPKCQTTASPLSMLQSFISMTPGVGASSSSSSSSAQQPAPKHIAVLSDVVLPSYQEIFDARYQHLENALVESLLRQRLVA